MSPSGVNAGEKFLMRFVGGRFPGNCVWTGPWPMPDEIWICKGRETGMVAHVDPAEIASSDLLALEEVSEIEKYVKARESQLPPMPSDGHVMRGAEYEVKS